MEAISGKEGRPTSHLEETLAAHFRCVNLHPEREYRFAAVAVGGPGKGLRNRLKLAGLKDWRFDFAFPDLKIAVEVEGGIFLKKKSRHTTGTGYQGDCEKYNNATLLGWQILRFTSQHVKSGQALGMVEKLIKQASNGSLDL